MYSGTSFAIKTLCALTLVLSACDNSSRRTEGPPQPQPQEPAPAPAPQPEQQPPRPAQAPPAPKLPQQEPARTQPQQSQQAPPPVGIPELNTEAEVSPDEQGEPSLRDRLGDATDYLKNKATEIGKNIKDSTESLVAGGESVKRRESLEESREQVREARSADLGDLSRIVDSTTPAPVERVNSAVRPSDEATTLLAAMISEADPTRVHAYTTLLVDEIFNEPEMSRAKVMKVQLGLRRVAENNLYDESVSRRVAYLQASLDKRVKTDEDSDLLRDGLLIAGTSLAFGAVAGFHGFEKTKSFVHEFSPRKTTQAVRESISNKYTQVKDRVGQLWQRKATATQTEVQPGGGRVAQFFRNVRLNSSQVAERNLQALGVNPLEVSNLDLLQIRRAEMPYLNFKDTNFPGFRYDIVDSWDGATLGNERMVVFSMVRWDRLGSRPSFLASRRMSAEEAEQLTSRVAFKAPEQGGKDFATIVDPQTGTATPTRISTAEADEILAANGNEAATQAKATPVKSRKSRKSVAEAQADGDIQPTLATQPVPPVPEQVPTPGLAAKTAAAAKDAANQIAGRTREAIADLREGARSTATSAGQALSRFDKPWAATVTALSAAPLYGFYFQGYKEGRIYGEGFESLYLESLIPRERLHDLTVELQTSTKKQP
jgi:hypothetical protein